MEELNDPTSDSGNYKWGIFYNNRKDPRVFVPKRFGMGYTLNFGKSYVTAGFVLILLVIFLKVFFL
jgi:uncharacterized membrane protein